MPPRLCCALFAAATVVVSACQSSPSFSGGDLGPVGLSTALKLSGPRGVATLSCGRFTVAAPDDAGEITVDVLGGGALYSSRAACQTGGAPAGPLALLPGETFYYRSDFPGAATLTARASTIRLLPTALLVTINDFQVLGEPDIHTDLFLERGLFLPAGSCIGGGKLFVVDTANRRVMAFNHVPTASLPVPDFVLGQPSPDEIDWLPAQATTLSFARACASDGTRLFVADTVFNRVLIWNTIPTRNGQPADVALGQPSMTSTASGVSASRMHAPTGVWSDGIRLYVADTDNDRVLVWSAIPTSTMPADLVIGQDGVGAPQATPSPSATTLWHPTGVVSDGTHLYIADRDNNRVVGFNNAPTSNGQAADFALGQPDLAHNDALAPSASTLNSPTAVALDAADGVPTLAVADTNNDRVLLWSGALPTISGQAASNVVGEPDFAAAVTWPIGSSHATSAPSSVALSGGKLLVTDTDSRALLWNAVPTAPGAPADIVLGDRGFSDGNDVNRRQAASSFQPFSVHGDGTRLMVADIDNDRVLIWNTLPIVDDQPADVVLGQADFVSTTRQIPPAPSAATLFNPTDMCSDGTHLYVVDNDDQRVLAWNQIPTSNGQPADLVLGQSSFTTTAFVSNADSMRHPVSVFCDGQRLWVSDAGNNRVLEWTTLPTVNGQRPDLVLGQPDLDTVAPSPNPVSAVTMNDPEQLYSDGPRLFVADTQNHRVLVWNALPTRNGQPADYALGQPDLNSAVENNGGVSARSLAWPQGITGDGSRIYVSDSGNARILGWSTAPGQSGAPASGLFGQSSFGDSAPFRGSGVPSATNLGGESTVYCDGTRLFIADGNSSRVLVVPAF